MAPMMIDLFSGLGGASVAMRERDWQVITVDIMPRFKPDLCRDVQNSLLGAELRGMLNGRQVDLLWASPPCNEFTRETLPWRKTGRPPKLEVVDATYRLIDELRPRWWILENVRGAVPYLGPCRQRFGSFYLWGNFPLVLCSPLFKGTRSSTRDPRRLAAGRLIVTPNSGSGRTHRSSALRAKVPYQLSTAVADTIERELVGGRRFSL